MIPDVENGLRTPVEPIKDNAKIRQVRGALLTVKKLHSHFLSIRYILDTSSLLQPLNSSLEFQDILKVS